MEKKYDYLIVGAGLYGATFAYLATMNGKRCLVIDKRLNVGGNLYCKKEDGINVHVYGAHIFHTSNEKVWKFVNSLVPFNRYTNSPVANYRGELYNLPFNMNTFHQMWGVNTPEEARQMIERQKKTAFDKLNGREPANLEEQALSLVGEDIYLKLIKEYTEKQWGRSCKELPAFIIKRLPVRFVYDNNYFNDRFQGIPIGGYNVLIDKLLKNVDIVVDTDFFESDYRDWRKFAKNLVYTGPLDRFFDYRYGKFDWRTVSFKTRKEEMPNFQGNAVVNYTSHEKPYTRIIEHKHFESFGSEVYDNPVTIISEEYSTEYSEGMEPYYPINNDRNNALRNDYYSLIKGTENPDSEKGKIIFGGRLAKYCYYDMDKVIEQCFEMASRLNMNVPE